MTPELRAAIDELYLAFGDVRKPGEIDVCPCCMELAEVEVLLSKKLKELTPDELSKYGSKVFNTVGDIPDFLYFLPRLLEIVVTNPDWWPDPEVLLPKLKEAGFPDWPDRRSNAVRHFLDAAFYDVMMRASSEWEFGGWICALGLLYDDVSPYLRQLEMRPALFRAYYEENSECLPKGKLTNSFWDENSTAFRQVMQWFNSPKIKNMIAEVYGL